MKNAEDKNHVTRTRKVGDQVALAVLFFFFAMGAFAMNPKGWGPFDWLAVSAFSLLGIWLLVRARLQYLDERRTG